MMTEVELQTHLHAMAVELAADLSEFGIQTRIVDGTVIPAELDTALDAAYCAWITDANGFEVEIEESLDVFTTEYQGIFANAEAYRAHWAERAGEYAVQASELLASLESEESVVYAPLGDMVAVFVTQN